MDFRFVRKVFGPEEYAWCGDCGTVLAVRRCDVFGFGIQCPDCIRKRLTSDPTPLQDSGWSKLPNLQWT